MLGITYDMTHKNPRREPRRWALRRRHKMPSFAQMSLGMPQDTTLTNRRRAWRQLLSRRRQGIPYMYSRSASGWHTTRHYRTDAERRAPTVVTPTSIRNQAKRSIETPYTILTNRHWASRRRQNMLSEGTRQDAGKSTQSIATPVVAKPTQDSWTQRKYKTRH
jgi:hypothetical protein